MGTVTRIENTVAGSVGDAIKALELAQRSIDLAVRVAARNVSPSWATLVTGLATGRRHAGWAIDELRTLERTTLAAEATTTEEA